MNYYKGYDIDNKNRLEKIKNTLNPFGYNMESNNKNKPKLDIESLKTNQDLVKEKMIKNDKY